METAAPSAPRHRSLIGFLLLSLFLHGAWLMLPLPPPASQGMTPRAAPLAVHLSPTPRPVEAKSAAPAQNTARRPGPVSAPRTFPSLPSQLTAPQPAEPPTASIVERPRPAVNMEQALATARSFAKEWRPTPNPLTVPTPPLTVEAAVARATAPDVVIETRGAAGQYVTKSKRSRCVTPLTVPHFLEGKSMLTQCEFWKG